VFTETVRPKREAIEGEIVEEAIKPISAPKGETIETTLIGAKQKKLTPEQAKQSNEIVDKMNKNLEVIKNRRRGLKHLKKKKQVDAYESEIRKLEAENISLEKKKPKL